MLNLYEPARMAAIRMYGPLAQCDHGLPLSEGCTACQMAGAPVIDEDDDQPAFA